MNVNRPQRPLMKIIKRTAKFFMWFVISFVGIVLIYFACERVLSRIEVEATREGMASVPVYILSNGVHTDVVMPACNANKDWTTEFPLNNTIDNDTSCGWIAVGWGDKGFYLHTPTWADLKASTALKALTGVSTSAIHATYYHDLREGKNCKRMLMSESQYKRLIAYVEKSLKRNSDGTSQFIKTTATYGVNDAFYEANRSYSIFHTCNTWANNALKAAGQKACLWTAFDTGIFLKYSDK